MTKRQLESTFLITAPKKVGKMSATNYACGLWTPREICLRVTLMTAEARPLQLDPAGLANPSDAGF